MKNTRLCKVRSELHLPADLWREILSRLPVKYLLRFRCVSKPCLSLIDNAEFARLYLNNFKNNRDETHLLVVHGRKNNNFGVRCSDTFETNSETLLSLGDHSEGIWEFVCSSDGLVVLMGAAGSGRFRPLTVWNPSIRKFHDFPPFPEFETSPDGLLDAYDIGLGYDPLAKDYKFVRLIFRNDDTLHSVAVYSLGGGSWKIIEFQGKGSSCSNWRWQCGPLDTGVYFQGSFYFILEDPHNRLVWDLVSFDLSNEVFSSISMPDDPYFRSNDFRGRDEIVLIDGGCSLAVFDCVSAWVLESSSSGAMHWTKRWSSPVRFLQLLYPKKNGDILTRTRRTETLTITSGTRKKRWDQITSYSPETGEYKVLEEIRGSQYIIGHVSCYLESLILLK